MTTRMHTVTLQTGETREYRELGDYDSELEGYSFIHGDMRDEYMPEIVGRTRTANLVIEPIKGTAESDELNIHQLHRLEVPLYLGRLSRLNTMYAGFERDSGAVRYIDLHTHRGMSNLQIPEVWAEVVADLFSVDDAQRIQQLIDGGVSQVDDYPEQHLPGLTLGDMRRVQSQSPVPIVGECGEQYVTGYSETI